MALEILGVFVDQLKEVVQEFMKRAACAKLSDYGDHTRTPARKYLQSPNLSQRRTLSANGPPKHSTLCRVEAPQRDQAKEVIQGLVGTVNLIEATGCASNQDDPGFGLQCLSELPARVRVHHVPKHHVEILHQEHESLAAGVRKIEKGSKTARNEGLIILHSAQIFPGATEGCRRLRLWSLPSETIQTLQPELAASADFVAFLRKRDRKHAG